ncbi:carbohydrate kinase family protein [Candidatus Gracilibacteria bacterium]|nr:carbohydrate kinase family protein [Candidatus Gracilibacteria bacterium]
MSLLISGSIAFDTIIQTVGNFRDNDIDRESDLHLSLFAPVVRREYGGTAANIAFSLALLGKTPHIIATAGNDSESYIEYLKNLGIKTELIHTIPTSPSLQSIIVHDDAHGQINIFHPGAMSMSGEISHGKSHFEYAIIAPDSGEGMIRRLTECKASGIFSIFDPGQAMVSLNKEQLISLVEMAEITIMNEPERIQFEATTGVDYTTIARKNNHVAIVTLGDNGAMILEGEKKTIVPTQKIENIVDATGCGDAFRSGLLYGLSEGWTLEKSVQLGNIIGSIKIQYMGAQNHTLHKDTLNAIGNALYSENFFD